MCIYIETNYLDHTIPTNQPANQPTNQPPPTQPASHKVRGSVSYLAKVQKNPTSRRERASLQKYRVLPLFFYANKWQ